MTPPPTRLRVLLATESDFALVLRSGPARHVAAIAWNRDRDTFKLGQWLKARINTCDLSPDGRHFLYCASRYDPKVGGRVDYTVMARAPYFTALHYWAPKHWVYGGAFFDNTRFWIYSSGKPEVRTLPHFSRVPDSPELKVDIPGTHMDTAAWLRNREGWMLQPDDYQRRNLWHKTLGEWTLARSIFNWRDGKSDFYELKHEAETIISSRIWSWADLDVPRKRLCYTQDGQLWSLALKLGAQPVLLHDFSAMSFEPRIAPY